MLKTNIDYSVLLDFFNIEPKSLKDGGSIEENEWYFKIFSFLKSKTDLQIGGYDSNSEFSNLINILTSGREDSKLYPIQTNSVLSKVPIIENNLHSLYFSELYDSFIGEIEKKCGLLIGNRDNYKRLFNDLICWGKRDKITVRKNSVETLKNWEEIKPYILPFTDVILYDNFILRDNNTIDENLLKIIEILSEKANVQFNLIIIYEVETFLDNNKKKQNYPKLKVHEKKITDFLKTKKINCSLGLIETDNKFKEHDRGIFMNYMRIYSGDSFNYFNIDGKIITKGTDIQFQYYSNPNNFNIAREALKNIKNIVTEFSKKLIPSYIGKIENRLLNNL